MRWIERPGKLQGNCARAVPGTPRGLTGGSALARTQLKVPIQSVVCKCLSTVRPTAWPAGTCSLTPPGPQSIRATPHPTAQPAGTCSLNFAGPGYRAGGGTPSPTEPRARHDTLPLASASTSRVGRPGRSGRLNCGGSRRGDCEAGRDSGMEPPGGGRHQRAAPGCLGGRARPEGGSVGPGLGTGGRGWRDSTEPDPGLLLIQRPAVSRRCLRRTGGVATTDRSGQRGHGSPQGLRAPGECGRRRALGWRFAVERISPRQAGEGRRPCTLGSVCGSRSPWPVRPDRAGGRRDPRGPSAM